MPVCKICKQEFKKTFEYRKYCCDQCRRIGLGNKINKRDGRTREERAKVRANQIPGKCEVCFKPLPGRRVRWCSETCIPEDGPDKYFSIDYMRKRAKEFDPEFDNKVKMIRDIMDGRRQGNTIQQVLDGLR